MLVRTWQFCSFVSNRAENRWQSSWSNSWTSRSWNHQWLEKDKWKSAVIIWWILECAAEVLARNYHSTIYLPIVISICDLCDIVIKCLAKQFPNDSVPTPWKSGSGHSSGHEIPMQAMQLRRYTGWFQNPESPNDSRIHQLFSGQPLCIKQG